MMNGEEVSAAVTAMCHAIGRGDLESVRAEIALIDNMTDAQKLIEALVCYVGWLTVLAYRPPETKEAEAQQFREIILQRAAELERRRQGKESE